ncbi:hypothetical protein NMG60_11001433 [Bertholletia excelsa]
MMATKLHFVALCFFLFSLAGNRRVQGSHHHHHHRGVYGFHPTKLFVFGDSYADTGNNRKSLANSWKFPYGITFPGKPAGRFSDGRVLTDFVAKYLGLKSPIAYRWRKYAPNRLRYGVNFAYGGTGVFDTLVLDPNMTTQIDFFQQLIAESTYSKQDLQSSLALVTAAGNDYSAYLANGGSEQDLPAFITRVVDQLAINLKRIHSLGVKRIAVAALQPLGCLPQITAASSFQQCNETKNTAVDFHNLLLEGAIAKLNHECSSSGDGKAFYILDLYGSFTSVLKHKSDQLGNLKFETPLKPCCIGMSSEYVCGSVDTNGEKLYTVCANPESAFFWDLDHPTQAGWRAVYLNLKSSLEQIC